MTDPTPSDLAALETRARWELETLDYPRRPWVKPLPGDACPVLIIGAGQAGLAIGFALAQARVPVLLLEALPPGGSAVWKGFARMATLRTPKHVLGPELGVPALSARAWYTARFGAPAWDALTKIPRTDWQDYLDWLAAMLALPTEHDTRVTAITPEADGLFTVAAGPRSWRARHVVLATGMDGLGAWSPPPFVAALPRTRWAHTAEPIDFAALHGRRVVVVGAGASAFDNATCALEAGAARVEMLVRRAELPRANPNRWMEFCGYLEHFPDLPDATRWRWMHHLFAVNQPPPQESFSRCSRHPGFFLRTGRAVQGAAMAGEAVRLETPAGPLETDFVILGTGLTVDPAARPELAAVAPHFACWRDRYTPPPGLESRLLGGFPYLDGSFAFTGAAPWLARLRTVGFAAMVSSGSSGGISTLGATVRRIVPAITRDLFLHQAPAHERDLLAYAEPELTDLSLASERDAPCPATPPPISPDCATDAPSTSMASA